MNNETLDLLEDVIQRKATRLSEINEGDEAYSDAVEGVSKLLKEINEAEKLKIEMVKVENDKIKNDVVNTTENRKITSELIGNIMKTAATITVAGAEIGLAIWGTRKTLKYDSDGGIVSTDAGKSFVKRLFRFKSN